MKIKPIASLWEALQILACLVVAAAACYGSYRFDKYIKQSWMREVIQQQQVNQK